MNQLRSILQSKIFLITLILITCFYVFIDTSIIKYKSVYDGSETKLIGKVGKIKKNSYGYSITIDSEEKLIVYTKKFDYKLGDIILVEGNLEIPKNNTIPNDFNYKEYLYQNKIFYTISSNNIKLIKENKNIIYKIKNSLLSYINNFKSKDYLNSFILGDTSYLDSNLYNSYQINGICHLLSIGSSHVSLLITLISFILKKLKINELVSKIIIFIILFFFIIFVDYQISIVRVYLYLVISFINKRLKLNLESIKVFIFVLLITLLINPFYIYNKGFLYSYSISFVLILNKNNLTGNYLKKLVKISFISFICSIPFNIYFNYSINLLSILYNLFYVPVFSIIVFPLSLLTLIFPILDNLFYQFMEIINNISYYLNNYTWGIIILKKISVLILIFYLLLATISILDIFNKKKKSLIILIITLLIHININNIIKNNLYMYIDVGQGDANLLFQDNQTILIDTGGLYNQSIYEKIITLLKSLGIKKINYLILTHGDYDHMGEAINLVNNFKVGKVIFNCGEYNNLEKDLIKVLDKKKIPYYSCVKELNIYNNKLYFLNNGGYGNENDNSSVIYTELNNHKFLFMGDAGVEVEENLIEKYNLKDIDVLKVGHHGSKTSSGKEFIDEVNPKYSIISVGKNNRYGHPNDSVLGNLNNSKIYRTDQDGSIMFKIKNNKLKI